MGATTLDITSTYVGEYAGKIIAPALLSAKTIVNGGVEVMPNVKKSSVIQKIDVSSIIKDGTCDFDPTSTVTLSERTLNPKELQVNLQLCKKDFINTWQAKDMGYSAFNEMPATFREFLMARFAAMVASRNETLIWRGVSTNNGEYNGLVTRISTDADLPAAQEVAGTTVTAANVQTELRSIISAAPDTIYGAEDLNIYVAPNIYKAYIASLGGFGTSGLGAAGINNQGPLGYGMGNALSIDGVPLFMTNGLASNTAILAQKSNLYFATGLESDYNEVKMIDMSDIDGSQNVRFVMRFLADANYGYAEEIVTYGITNSAN